MTLHRVTGRTKFLLLSLAAPMIVACGGGSSDVTAPPQGNNQTASAVATPASATIVRGGTTNTTVVYSASSDLTIGSSFGIQTTFGGITVTQTSSQRSGNTITRAYTVSTNASVPLGKHTVKFSTAVSGYTGTGTAPTSTVGFDLTVTQ